MNDYRQMRDYLDSLDRDGLLEYSRKLGWSTTDWNDGEEDERSPAGDHISTPWPQWRKLRIDRILTAREGGGNLWEDVCHAAGIETDAAAQVRLACETTQSANRSAKAAWTSALCAAFGLTITAVALSLSSESCHQSHIAETPIDRALAECRQCGMTDAKILRLIANVSERGNSRERELELFDATFKQEDTHRDACEPCLQAVLNAAGVVDSVKEP